MLTPLLRPKTSIAQFNYSFQVRWHGHVARWGTYWRKVR